MGLFQNCGNDRDPLGTRLAKRGLVLRGARGGGAEELAVGVQTHVVGEQVPLRVTLVGHGAELDKPEYPFALARAGLREEGVAMHLDGTEDGEHEQQRAQADNGQERAAEIKDSF